MDLKTLIYTKSFDNELTQKLLFITDSKTWLEDLVDLIGEVYEEPERDEDCEEDCDKIDELNEEIDNVKAERDLIYAKVTAKIIELRKRADIHSTSVDEDHPMDQLSSTIDNYIDYRIERMEAIRKKTVGGVELPKQYDQYGRIG